MSFFSGSLVQQFLQVPATLLVLFATICVIALLRRMRKNTRLPPGPFSWPIIGNLHLLRNKPHERLTELAKTFGDVYTLQLGSRRVIVLNSLQSVQETLVKKSSSFSRRPPLRSLEASDMNGRSISFGSYSSVYLKNRRLAQLCLHSLMLNQDQLSYLVRQCTIRLCERFAKHREHFDPLCDIQVSIAELSLETTFGEDVTKNNREKLCFLMKSSREFIRSNNISNLVDYLPWLSLFLKDTSQMLKQLVQKLVDFVRQIYLQKRNDYTGQVKIRCVADALIRCYENGSKERLVALGEELDLNEENNVALLTDLFGASMETTSTTLIWAILYLASHANIQERLYKELRDSVGENCLSVNDKHRLPFLEATVLEILRYSTVLPLAIPHYAEHESSVGPYTVPGDTIIVVNLWAINHDPTLFKEPFKFHPSRFLDENGQVSKARFSSIPFSTGSRKCLGHLLAQDQLFLLLGGIVQNYRIELSYFSTLAPEFGFILRPQSFKIKVCPREKYGI